MPASGTKAEAAPSGKASALKAPSAIAPKADAAPAASNKKAVIKVKMAAPAKPKSKGQVPDGLAKKYYIKSTFNTSDIMHSPVEKTIRMLDKILSGEKLFTM